MPMEEDLIARLNAVPAIAALAGDRISWFARVRGDALPALVINPISPGREWTHDGPDGLDQPRLQFDAFAETDLAALALARAVQAELETTTPVEVGTTRFHPAMLAGAGFTDEGEQDGGKPLFRVIRDFMFYHEPI